MDEVDHSVVILARLKKSMKRKNLQQKNAPAHDSLNSVGVKPTYFLNSLEK